MAGDHAPARGYAGPFAGMDARDDAVHGAGGFVDLKLGHYNTDGIEFIDVEVKIDIYTAPRLRELLIDLVSKNTYQLIVNMDRSSSSTPPASGCW